MSATSQHSQINLWRQLWTQLSSIAGAVGLASLFRDIVAWKAFFVDLIDAWQKIARPISDFLFGWIFRLIDVPFPVLLQDYLMISIILTGGIVRMCVYLNSNQRDLLEAALENMTVGSRITIPLDKNRRPFPSIPTIRLIRLCIYTLVAWPLTLLYFILHFILVWKSPNNDPSVVIFSGIRCLS